MAGAYRQQHGGPSAYPIQHASPLDTLVRSASTKGSKYKYQERQEPVNFNDDDDDEQAYGGTHEDEYYHQRNPSSPLLHSRFARGSQATFSSRDANSYLDFSRDSVDVDSGNMYHETLGGRFDDNDGQISPHEPTSPALRDSWKSDVTAKNAMDPHSTAYNDNDTYHEANVPVVVVSAWAETGDSDGPASPDGIPRYSTYAGKTPMVKPVVANFSRPVRPAPQPSPTRVEFDPGLNDGIDHKKVVLDRNAARAGGGSAQPQPRARSPYTNEPLPYGNGSSLSGSAFSPTLSSPSSQGHRSRSPSPSPTHISHSPSTPMSANSVSTSSSARSPQAVSLPRNPREFPGRSNSPISLYSTYSFYQLDSASPSPTNSTSNFSEQQQGDQLRGTHTKVLASPPSRTTSHSGTPTQSGFKPTRSNLSSELLVSANQTTSPQVHFSSGDSSQDPLAHLQLGIAAHESNDLKTSAFHFERSATLNGGTGVGMLMWGLTLRHGWGCKKDEKGGFKWLRKAAEGAVDDLEARRTGTDAPGSTLPQETQNELVLAIYEVGQCFFHGWGVGKDQKMGVSYYTVAARLGDADAQSDLAFCLANGKGCKKDRKEAAKWYREAVKQGQSDIGLAWIYKEKFQ